jgi:hypothetical protein
MAASKRGRAERLAALEQLIKPPREPVEDEFAPEQLIKRLKPGKPGGRTIADEWAVHGFSEAEKEREAQWVLLCLRLEAEREVERRRLNAGGYTPDPGEEAASRQRISDYEEAASEGARWLHCRMEHGPGLCEADCAGEFRHRSAWKPATLGTSLDDFRQAALIAQVGVDVPDSTSPVDDLAERRAALPGDELAGLPWSPGAPARKDD